MADKPPLKLKICFLDATRRREAISLLHQALNINDRKAEKFIDNVIASNRFHGDKVAYAAIADGRLVGMVAGERPANDNANTATIMDLAVDEDYQGRGIGRQLMAKVENYIAREWLKGQFGYARLYDRTKRIDSGSAYYEGMGYELDETHGYHNPHEPPLRKALNLPVALPATA